MSSRRTSEPTLVGGVRGEAATIAVLAIGVAASLLIAGWLFACADSATIGESLTPEHGAIYCPDCHFKFVP